MSVHMISNKDKTKDIVQHEVEQFVSTLTPDSIADAIDKMENKLGLCDENNSPIDDRFALNYFGFKNVYDIDPERVYEFADTIMRTKLKPIFNKIIQEDWYGKEPVQNKASIGKRINRIIALISHLKIHLVNLSNMNSYKNSAAFENQFDPRNIGAPTVYDPELGDGTLNDLQGCIIYALNRLGDLKYRRYQDYVCKQIRNTKAWEKVSKIDVFVENLFQKENFALWSKFTKSGNVRKNLIEHLTVCNDSQFPELKKDRHVFSFKNGLYVTKDSDGKPKFYPYTSDAFKCLDPTIVSSKYFDVNFDNDDYVHWYDIPTPSLDAILNYQKFDDDVKKCIMYFIGRMLYEVNEMEKWQVIMFLKGMASTGKGMICQLSTYFYEDEDIGTLGDNPEKQFGLSAIYDKFAFIAPEITGRFGLGQADFQSMVSGENVSIGRKFKTAESVRWTVPGILAGNEPPGYHDNSGSIQRRLVTIPFPIQVKPEDIDTELPDKLRAEVPMIMRKVNEAYHEAVANFVTGGIWAYLPQAIKNTREEMALSTNALRHFMAAPCIEYDAHKEIPLNLLITHFNEHCKANNLGRYKFTPDFYNGPFSSKGIEVVQKSIIYKNGKSYKNHQIVVGMDVTSDDDDMSYYNNDL